MKKIWLIIICTFLIIAPLEAQNLRRAEPLQYLYVSGGLIFSPASKLENKPESIINFCKTTKLLYFLNGLQLPEKTFYNLGLKSKDVFNGEGKYSFIYKKNDTTKCIKYIKMSITSILPIYLNGIKLGESDYSPKLSHINSDDIVSVKRKSSLFGKAKIEIITK